MKEEIKNYTPRWIILGLDLSIAMVSIVVAFFLRFNFDIPDDKYKVLYQSVIAVGIVRLASYLIGRMHIGIVRYTSLKDAQRIFLITVSGSVFLELLNIVTYTFINGRNLIPNSIIIIDFLITIFLLIFSRLLIRSVFAERKPNGESRINVAVFGTERFGIIAKNTLERSSYNIVAFLEDSDKWVRKTIEGIPVYNLQGLGDTLEKLKVNQLVFARESVPAAIKNEIVDICLQMNVKVLTIPPVDRWINGELSFNQLKRIKIEDLLQRPPIEMEVEKIRKYVQGKVILITGAAGSIGSELVRQIARFSPRSLVLVDQAESELYDLQLELEEKFHVKNAEYIIASITDYESIRSVFERTNPNLVFHAAAYKHVPMMEGNPVAAVKTNVSGTKNIADLSSEFGIEKFVMISTDKAVNPTNLMGATKRVAEMYIQSLNTVSKTNYVTTRFGNVLGSNGSVIPRFRKQIEAGGPVTITHPEITRYFMTIPESCQLVLEAGAMGKGGEIFIFDMGQSVKIVDLAKTMIKLSGLKIGQDIQIVFTGLRPGEKLYEELLFDKENSISTYHEQIMIAKVVDRDFEVVRKQVEDLLNDSADVSNMDLVSKLKDILPEFKSKNSIYQVLDS